MSPTLQNNPSKQSRNRLPMIDIAKGIGILLIVLGHSASFEHHFPHLNDTLRSIRIPFFFFMSGVTFSVGARSLTDIAILRADAWLKPYAVTVLLFGMIDIFIRGTESYTTVFLGLVYATGFTLSPSALWFLPHLWLIYVACSALMIYGSKLIDSPIKKILLLSTIVVAGAYLMDAFDSDRYSTKRFALQGFDEDLLLFGLPFSADLLPLTCAFFLLGNFLSHHVKVFRLDLFKAILAFAGVVVSRYFFDFSMDLNYRRYDNVIVTTLQAFFGIYFLLSASLALTKIRAFANALTYVGRTSLFILLFHMPILQSTPSLLASFISSNSAKDMIALAAAVTIPIIMWKLAQRTASTKLVFFPAVRRDASRA